MPLDAKLLRCRHQIKSKGIYVRLLDFWTFSLASCCSFLNIPSIPTDLSIMKYLRLSYHFGFLYLSTTSAPDKSYCPYDKGLFCGQTLFNIQNPHDYVCVSGLKPEREVHFKDVGALITRMYPHSAQLNCPTLRFVSDGLIALNFSTTSPSITEMQNAYHSKEIPEWEIGFGHDRKTEKHLQVTVLIDVYKELTDIPDALKYSSSLVPLPSRWPLEKDTTWTITLDKIKMELEEKTEFRFVKTKKLVLGRSALKQMSLTLLRYTNEGKTKHRVLFEELNVRPSTSSLG